MRVAMFSDANSPHPLEHIYYKFRDKLNKSQVSSVWVMPSSKTNCTAARAAINLGIPVTLILAPQSINTNQRRDFSDVFSAASRAIDPDAIEKFGSIKNIGNRVQRIHEWMIDESDAILIYWRPEGVGAVENYRHYAQFYGTPVSNCYERPPF